MANQKKMVKNLKASEDQFVGATGIITAKHYASSSNHSSDSDSNVGKDPIFGAYKDPVPPHNRNAQRALIRERKEREKTPEPITKETILEPSVSFRLHMKTSKPRITGAIFVAPKTKAYKKAAKERREKQKEFNNFCQYDVVKVPSPSDIGYVRQNVKIDSPQVSKAKVIPQRPSVVPDTLYPYPPTASQLEAKKPKSGIFINEIGSSDDEPTGPLQKKEPSKKKQNVKKEKQVLKVKKEEEEEEYMDFLEEEYDVIDEIGEPSTALEERTRKTASLTSAQTSYNSKDIETFDDVSWANIPLMSKLVQTFRSENDEPVKKKPAKGSLENHSFTKLKQNVPQDFCFKSTHGSIHQGNENFSITTRNRQGICMPVTAFCYAAIHRPKNWTAVMIDDIVELGEAFYLNCIAEFHVHRKKELKAAELDKYVYIEDKRIKFKIEDPTINGDIRSKDRLVFNILKGLRIFFKRYRAGIIQAKHLNVVVWKQKKHYYMFDAVARRKDLHRDPNGTALLMIFQTIPAIAAVLLDRSDLEDVRFNISRIEIVKILGKDEEDKADLPDTHSVYNILSDKKAVVQGSFDLGDKCFQFTRNKQALTMAVVALVYARITPPSIWRRKTVDKIMIVGNQLYRECREFENVTELKIQNLPAVFTIGPYMCEIFIYAGRFADNMYKKGVCVLCEALLEYFEDSTNAILQINHNYIAVWQQRGLYYVFDPYSRNSEALNCRRGTACVSMNSDINTVIDTITINFNEPNVVFYIHAVKVLKVHRDPALSRLFPKNANLNDVPIESFKRSRMRKSKKKAIERPVRTNFTEYAMKKLLAGEEPEPSILEIGSNIMSLNDAYIPEFVHTVRKEVKQVIKEMDFVVDLDSPSLSDTQLNRPTPCGCRHDDELTFQDLDSYELTVEEMDVQEHGEDGLVIDDAEEDEVELLAQDFEAEDGEDDAIYMEKYFVKDEASHVHPEELENKLIEEAINTDLSYQYKVLPAIEFPPKRKKAKGITIDLEAQAEELKKSSHYKTKQDTFEILWAVNTNGEMVSINNYSDYHEILAPYINIMATAFSKELAIGKWNKKHVDFLLRAGCQLYENYREEYKNIDDYEFEFQKNKFTVTIEKSLDTFVGNELLHTAVGRQAIGLFLEQHVFNDSDMGIIIINGLCISVFLKRNLFYMFDCYACNKIGSADEHSSGMAACVTRYPDLSNLLMFLTYNLQRREDPNKDYGTYRKLILLKPRFTTEASPTVTDMTSQLISEPSLSVTQSKELAKPTNFVDLPDDTQIVRGSTDVSNFGPDVEFIAPFVCVVTSAVAGKYSIHTWSKQIVDYVVKCGSEVYKKSKVRFDQVSKLEIPKVSLGTADYSVTVDYLLDSPMKPLILESCLRKVLRKDYWAIIVTKTYSCACYCRNKLLYLYDPFPCNELGLSEGPNTDGVACLARFKTLKSLTERIIYNKNKHEDNDGGDKIEYTKFVLSICKAKRIIRPHVPPSQKKTNKRPTSRRIVEYEDEQYEDEDDFEEMPAEEEEGEDDVNGEEKKESENKLGYQKRKNIWVIEGTKSIAPVSSAGDGLNEDHFISLVACLMAIDKPVVKWDTKRVDTAIDQGQHVFTHADNLEVSEKRTIKNILVGTHFFDIIVRMIHISLWRDNKNIETGLNTVLRKRKFVIVQFPNCAYVVFKDEDCVHLFSPYASSHKVKKNETISVQAGWQKLLTVKRMTKTIRSKMAEGLESYYFYSFDVISVRKAPKKLLLRHRLDQYHLEVSAKAEALGKPFHEKEEWLNIHQSPWSRSNAENTASGAPRGRSDTKWHYWDVEYPNDLFSLIGTIHQTSHVFKPRNRGKQTLANLVVAVGMTSIYEFSEWNAAVLDAILICGDTYFTECVKDITKENYELAVEDLKTDCTVFPYSFKVNITPIIEGSMFVTNPRVFNLYKALRYFFEGFDRRCGFICAAKSLTEPTQPPSSKKASLSTPNLNKIKRHLAFGKTGEKEYFLYDCQGYGQPMFVPGTGVGYALRCKTQARLLHALVVTLRGGDFYVFEIATSDFNGIME